LSVNQDADEKSNRATPYGWMAVLVALAGSISMVLSSTIVNVAFPDIMGAFGVGQDQAQWASTAFLASMTICMLLYSWLHNAIGQKRTYTLVLCVFLTATLICGSAQSIEALIVGRVMQGACAGIIQPLAMTTIYLAFPPERRGFAMGIFGLGVVVAPAIGPFLGGLAIEAASWRYVFYLPAPFCVLGLLGAQLYLPPANLRRPPSFDWTGFVLLSVAITLALYVLANGQKEGWASDLISGAIVVAIVFLSAFGLWEHKFARAPLFHITLMRIPQFFAATMVAFVFGAAIYGSTYLVPIFVQLVQHYPPTKAGLLLMPGGLILAVIFPLSGWLADTVPPRILMVLGFATMAAGSALISGADINTTFWILVAYTLIQRFGLGLIHPTLNATALRAVPERDVAAGAGMLNFFRQLGGSAGVVAAVIAYDGGLARAANAISVAQISAEAPIKSYLLGAESALLAMGADATTRQALSMAHLENAMTAAAIQYGFEAAFGLLAVVALGALAPAWIMTRIR